MHSHNENHVLSTLDITVFDDTVAYLSDAGMPGISDPGSALVRFCQENKIAYEIVPGANAALLAYVASGIETHQFLFYGFFKESLYFTIWLSVFFLASLPSTVSSSVVMVSMAKGNVTSAIFNASISGLIGILMTPLLMSFFFTLEKSEESGDLMQIFYELLKKVILPIVLGLLFNSFLKKWVIKYSKWIAEFDRLIILLIVYESFSAAFLNKIFSSVPVSVFLILASSVIVLFFVVY